MDLREGDLMDPGKLPSDLVEVVDMVNHPPHYNGPQLPVAECDTYGSVTHWLRSTMQLDGRLHIEIKCLDIMRHIKDVRLATALKYVWRVGFGGKAGADKNEDIRKAIVYLNDYLDNPVA